MICCSASAVRSQWMVGADITYGGKGADKFGHAFELAIPIYRGDLEWSLSTSYSVRYTSEALPKIGGFSCSFPLSGDPTRTYNDGNQSSALVGPLIYHPRSRLGAALRIGVSSQEVLLTVASRTSPDRPYYARYESEIDLAFGLDVHWRAIDQLQLKAGYSPTSGFGLGAMYVLNFGFLKKE